MRKRRILITFLYVYLFLRITTSLEAVAQEKTDSSSEPVGLMLTWQQDPLTTMLIDWQTKPDDEALPVLYCQKMGDEGGKRSGRYLYW